MLIQGNTVPKEVIRAPISGLFPELLKKQHHGELTKEQIDV